MKTREQIIADNPIEEYLASRGHSLTKHGAELYMRCPFHSPDNHPSFQVNPKKQVWMCGPCGKSGSVIDLVMQYENKTLSEAMKILSGNEEPIKAKPAASQKIVETYVYEDQYGKPRFRVHRIEPGNAGKKKSFRQEKFVNGQWIPQMDGVERLLYRTPEIMKCDTVWIVEGERKADWLANLGICATSCVGGGNAWMESYADELSGKSVCVCRDNDDVGEAWEKTVSESLAGKVKEVRFVRMPQRFNDVVDFIRDVKDDIKAGDQLVEMYKNAPAISRGIDLPVYGMDELKTRYKQFVERSKTCAIHLHRWLPSLKGEVRALVPGEMVTVMADTGVGKSAILQNIAHTLKDVTVLFFELELPDSLMTERFLSLDNSISGSTVEEKTGSGEDIDSSGLNHIWVCPESHMSTEKIEQYIKRSELKIGKKPDVVMVDYIGLVRGGYGKRYERVSSIAEDLKVIAKSTGTVLFLASQIHRKEEDDNNPTPVNLHDGRDSSSIECSSGLVLGAWKEDRQTMVIKVLKSTKGGAGLKITCNFDASTLQIRERINYDQPND